MCPNGKWEVLPLFYKINYNIFEFHYSLLKAPELKKKKKKQQETTLKKKNTKKQQANTVKQDPSRNQAFFKFSYNEIKYFIAFIFKHPFL